MPASLNSVADYQPSRRKADDTPPWLHSQTEVGLAFFGSETVGRGPSEGHSLLAA